MAYRPAVYEEHGGDKARNLARNPSDVLDEKFDFLNPKPSRVTKTTRSRSTTSSRANFENAYDWFRSPGRDEVGSKVYEELVKVLPNISDMNSHILALAEFIRRRADAATFKEFMEKREEFDALYREKWFRLSAKTDDLKVKATTVSKQKFKLDESRRALSFEGQIVKKDVIRYIHQIYTHRAVKGL